MPYDRAKIKVTNNRELMLTSTDVMTVLSPKNCFISGACGRFVARKIMPLMARTRPIALEMTAAPEVRARPRVGIKIKAINKDAESVISNVIGRYFINSPTSPGQKAKGAKAASVVKVEVVMGQAIRFAASLKACRGEAPSESLRSAYSTTTIAPSTNIPDARISEKSTTMLMVRPNALKIKKPIR